MIVRLAMLASAALIAAGGLSASAYSITQGATDQAIAFGWPTVALALALAMLAPPRPAAAAAPARSAKQGA